MKRRGEAQSLDPDGRPAAWGQRLRAIRAQRTKLRVLIVDEHGIMAEAIRPALERQGLQVLGIASSSAEALSAATVILPDVVLAAVWTASILEQSQQARALRVLAARDPAAVFEAIRVGFETYLAHRTAEQSPLRSGHRSAPRPTVSGAAAPALDRMAPPTVSAQLTHREQQVLALLCDGLGNKEIARMLALRLNTVRTHIQNLFAKLQVHSRLEAVTLLRQHALQPAPVIDEQTSPVTLGAQTLLVTPGEPQTATA